MDDFETEQPQREIYSVSQLASDVRQTLEQNFPLTWVEGEISNLANPASGHIYFSLKDSKAQVRCAMFKMRKRLLDFEPENGMQVLVRAKVGLYEARGDFQLIIEHMEEAGDGAMRREYEALKRRLRNEGLFEAKHKQSIPKLPKQIGIVTSPTGAAIHDMLTVLKRRFPSIPVLIYPVPVQGETAAKKISKAIKLANTRKECDVLIISRGGGSLEDLWAFNDEHLAHTIFSSKIPIISAVGHEVDFSIADFVADVRAPTPSAAAELLSPDRNEWLQRLNSLSRRLVSSMQNRLSQNSQRMDWLSQRVSSPQQRLDRSAQRIKELQHRLLSAQRNQQQQYSSQLQILQTTLLHHTPTQRIQKLQQQQALLQTRLRQSMQKTLQINSERLSLTSNTLDAVSPLATLGRGYSIARRIDTGELIRDAAAIKKGTRIETRLEKGRLICNVEDSKTDS
ncbi:MAG: exodeoxyribonuclease VII large subunit [Sulfuriflexus sp.]|nr:exodeoxyribonuclease VII large subunit [Sulfuriflexus sp.]